MRALVFCSLLVTAYFFVFLSTSIASDSERTMPGLVQETGQSQNIDEITGGTGGGATCAEHSRDINRKLKGLLGRFAWGPKADISDVAYGGLPLEKFDVFKPENAVQKKPAPIIVMVHGGVWCVGDKGLKKVTKNKVDHWVPKGFLFVSVNYPMVSDGYKALAQAAEVAKALAFIQNHAADWGGDPTRIILMGHSAGAHLVSLVNADNDLRARYGVKPFLGTVSLDSAALNVPNEIGHVYPNLKEMYLEALGTDEQGWISVSPYYKVDRSATPWLGVCSLQRKDNPCGEAKAFSEKLGTLGIKAAVLPQDKSHDEINNDLGEDGAYTAEVEKFMASLDPVVSSYLANH